MAAKAELKARLSLDKSLFDRGIASAQSSVTHLSRGLVSAARIGAIGMAALGAAAVGLGTALVIGTKKAFDLGGGLADMSAISGRSVKSILLMRRALEDAGVSIEKVNRFILTGKDRGNVIGRALQNLTAKDWQDAAQSVGEQANILERDSKVFDRVSDLLGRSGDKLQGFFVGVADKVSSVLLPILEKFDKMDFAQMGQRFGNALVNGAQALVGFFNNPQLLFDTATAYFRASILGLGNVMIAAFKAGLVFLQNGLPQAFAGIGDIIVSTLIDAFKEAIAYLQAGLGYALEFNSPGRVAQRNVTKLQGWIAGAEEEAKPLKPGSGATEPTFGAVGAAMGFAGKSSLEDAEAYKDKLAEIAALKQDLVREQKALNAADKTGLETIEKRKARILEEGVKFGLGVGKTSAQIRARGSQQFSEGLAGATSAAKGFQVDDILGAGQGFAHANSLSRIAAFQGAQVLPLGGTPSGPTAAPSFKPGGFSGHMVDAARSSLGSATATSPYAYHRTFTKKKEQDAYDAAQTAAASEAAKEKEAKPLTETGLDRVVSKYWGDGE